MTTLTQPITKLYKRCARDHHDTCPGSFETWSICSCDCHAGVSDMRAATTMPVKVAEKPVTCADKAEAVSEAIAITTPSFNNSLTNYVKPKRTAGPRIGNKTLARNAAGGYIVPKGSYRCLPASAFDRKRNQFDPDYFNPCPPHAFISTFKPSIGYQIRSAGYYA